MRHEEKATFEDLVCLNSTRGFQKEEDVEGDEEPGRLVMKTEENMGKVRTLERTVLFRYQNNSRGVECGQRNGVTNFNMKKVCAKMVPKKIPISNYKTVTNTQTCSVLTRSSSM
jgi:hypothetical protein